MKQTALLLLLFAFCFTLVNPASAAPAPQLVNAPEQLAYVDAQVELFTAHLDTFEAAYLAEHGQYFQALASHSTAPDSIQPPDGMETHPTYQDETLATLWTAAALPYELGWSFNVSTYDGPEGMGYVLTVETVVDGNTYRRAVNTGPETYRAAEWYQVIEEDF